jgi:hypothetical protein
MMNLKDHFHPPLSVWRPWHSVHHSWCVAISADLNTRLPRPYVAMPNVQFNVEIDVATFEGDRASMPVAAGAGAGHGGGGAAAVAEAMPWSPPSPALSVRLPLVTDVVETLIYREEGGLVLAAAIELVSPANKDRPEHRRAFVAKCQSYLQQGLGFVMIDIVTDRHANLHDELLECLDDSDLARLDAPLYAAAYHPVERDDEARLDVWQQPLAVGSPLPRMPLWVKGGPCLPVELANTYERACRELLID